MVVVGIWMVTLLNLFLTHYITHGIIFSKKDNKRPDRIKIFFYSLGKTLILFGALALGVQFMGKRVILALFNHVVQIFALGIILSRSR